MASNGTEALAAELAGESALSLGRAGARLQAALDALRANDARGLAAPAVRAELVDAAGEQAWNFIVMRAALGWYDEQAALDAYEVPGEVRARMGVRRAPTPAPAPARATSPGDGMDPPYR